MAQRYLNPPVKTIAEFEIYRVCRQQAGIVTHKICTERQDSGGKRPRLRVLCVGGDIALRGHETL